MSVCHTRKYPCCHCGLSLQQFVAAKTKERPWKLSIIGLYSNSVDWRENRDNRWKRGHWKIKYDFQWIKVTSIKRDFCRICFPFRTARSQKIWRRVGHFLPFIFTGYKQFFLVTVCSSLILFVFSLTVLRRTNIRWEVLRSTDLIFHPASENTLCAIVPENKCALQSQIR